MAEVKRIKSVRVGEVHITLAGTTPFKSINAAKRQSRVLGGASAVRAFDKHPGDSEVARLLAPAA